MSFAMYNRPHTPAMPLPVAKICGDAHFGGSFLSQVTLENTQFLRIMRTNNTPQAYLPVHRHDAQTGGLLVSGGGNEI